MMNEIEQGPPGGSIVGYLTTTKDELVRLFGDPSDEKDEYKTQNAWNLKMNGEMVCIYDYKLDNKYEDWDIIEFHVAGKSIQALFELMVVGFEPSQVLTFQERRDRMWAKFA